MAFSEVEVIDLECCAQQNSDPVEEVVSVDSGAETGKSENAFQEELEIVSSSTSSECEVVFSNVRPKNSEVASDQQDAEDAAEVKDPEVSSSLFIIDKAGGDDTAHKPLYTNECVGVLGEGDSISTPARNVLPSMACFNCGEDHHMSHCTKEVDRARVARNRREANKNSIGKSPRYHHGEEQMKRFQPGHISDEMRRALDIGSRELPPFIYRMRVLGYPPGWLMEATVESSGLKIYGSDGKAIDDDSSEDGEVQSMEKRVQYDASKLVSFPGFNVPTPPGVYDQYEKYDMPPMQPHQQRSEAEKYMRAAPAAPSRKRKKHTWSAPKEEEETVTEVDMDLDPDMDAGLNGDADVSSVGCNAVLASSPSDPKGQDSTGSPCPCSPVSASSVQAAAESQSSSGSAAQEECDKGAAKKNDRCDNIVQTPSPRSSSGKVYMSQGVTLGTPIIGGWSKYNSLPPRENFAKGISEHIPFENLPGATGTYDRLRGVLTKIRKVLSDERSKFDSDGTSGS